MFNCIPTRHRLVRRRVLAAVLCAAVATAALLAAPAAMAQSDKPPIRILVGFPAGGTAPGKCVEPLAAGVKEAFAFA